MKPALCLFAALAAGLATFPAAAQEPGTRPAPAARGPSVVVSRGAVPGSPAGAWIGPGRGVPRMRPPPPYSASIVALDARDPVRLDRYTYWGTGIGAAAGLTYGLAAGDDALGLSPVIEMVIGAGVGFYVGAAADIVRSLRSRARRR